MKRIFDYKKAGNIYTIIPIGLNIGLADINGNPNDYNNYLDYVNDGNLGNIKVFEFVKNGGVIESISNSNYIEIIDNIPQWKVGIEKGLLDNLNPEIRQQRQLRYTNECDVITVEIKRRELISDITEEEKQVLITELKTKSDLIKSELPYYEQINL